MKLILIILGITFYSSIVKAGSIFIDIPTGGYSINSKELTSKDKTCFLINCIKNEWDNNSTVLSGRPLIVFKIFDWKMIKSTRKPSGNFLSLDEYCKQSVMPALLEDMKVSIATLRPFNNIVPVNTFDSIVISKRDGYEIYTGFISAEFFNLIEFPQINVLQSNRTMFNIGSDIVPVTSWVSDSLPIPAIEEMPDNKMFLLKRAGTDFTFFCHPSSCSDCPLNFYNEYVYRKDYGVIAFKSKYIFRIKDLSQLSVINESDEYYYFK